MQARITVLFETGAPVELQLDGAEVLSFEAARRWLDEQFVRLECEPLRGSGKVLLADKLIQVAASAGPAGFADAAWALDYARAASGALSKALVRPETSGSRRIDFRISCYQPMAHVQEHVHQVQEQAYYVIEGEGVRRAKAWADDADLRLWIVDGFHVKQGEDRPEAVRTGDWVILNKADIADPVNLAAAADHWTGKGLTVLRLAGKSEDGAATLRNALASHVAEALSGAEFPAATRLRHAERLAEAKGYLERALSDVGLEVELAAEDVRLAARALEKISGRIDPEDVLGRVFSTFCIGK